MSCAPRLRSLLLLGILSVLLLSSTANARPALTTDARYSRPPQGHDPASSAGSAFDNWVKSWWAETPGHDKAEAAAPADDKAKAPVEGKGLKGSKVVPLPAQGAGALDVPDVPAAARPANRPPVALPFDDMLDENGYVRVDRPADPWQVAHRVRVDRNQVDDGNVSESGSEGSSRQSSRPASPSYDEANEPSRPATPNLDKAGEAPGTSRGPAAASRPPRPPVDEAAKVGGGRRAPTIGGSRPPMGPGGGAPSVAGGRVHGGQAASIFRNAAANTAATTEGTVAAILGIIGIIIP